MLTQSYNKDKNTTLYRLSPSVLLLRARASITPLQRLNKFDSSRFLRYAFNLAISWAINLALKFFLALLSFGVKCEMFTRMYQGFPYCGMGWSSPTTAENLLIPPPPPTKIPSVDSPSLKINFAPLNNNFQVITQ